jgi:hypothetical protein
LLDMTETNEEKVKKETQKQFWLPKQTFYEKHSFIKVHYY